MTFSRLRVGFIGTGMMGGALAQAFVAAARVEPHELFLYDRISAVAGAVAERTGGQVAASATALCRAADVVVLAVKPQDLHALFSQLGQADFTDAPRSYLSIAAGIRLTTLRSAIGPGPAVIRAMPNRPALVRAGITALMGDRATDAEAVDEVQWLLEAAGGTVRLEDESHFDGVTALSGSGPAFVFRMVEGLIAGGQAAGLSPEVARQLSLATLQGAARLLEQLGTSPEGERIAVTSPGGTTVAGLAELRKRGFLEAARDAVIAAAVRSSELGRELADEDRPK